MTLKVICIFYFGTRVESDQLYQAVEKGELIARKFAGVMTKPDINGEWEFSNKCHVTEVLLGVP